MKITDEEIQKDLKVCERANEKEFWIYRGESSPGGIRIYSENGDAFIELARTRWPLYIKELKELREENEALKNEQKILAISLKS